MKYVLLILLIGCIDDDTEQANIIIRESQEKFRMDSILIERQAQIKIEEYKAKK